MVQASFLLGNLLQASAGCNPVTLYCPRDTAALPGSYLDVGCSCPLKPYFLPQVIFAESLPMFRPSRRSMICRVKPRVLVKLGP